MAEVGLKFLGLRFTSSQYESAKCRLVAVQG